MRERELFSFVFSYLEKSPNETSLSKLGITAMKGFGTFLSQQDPMGECPSGLRLSLIYMERGMSSARQNRHIARLIVGAMSIDGSLSREEQKKVAQSLEEIGMPELVADVGAAIEDYCGTFDMYQECRELLESLGKDSAELAPMMFRMICDVIAHDRFVSAQEATYLASIGRRFKLTPENARSIFKQVMAANRSRLEVAGDDIDELINPHLKALLSFDGADELVGELPENSMDELLHNAKELLGSEISITGEDVERALTVLGLDRTKSLDCAEEVWKETIENLNLPKMSNLGETYVTAAINRITRINDAYKTVLHFHEHLEAKHQAKQDVATLEKQIKRSNQPSSRDELAGDIEEQLTGVGTDLPAKEETA